MNKVFLIGRLTKDVEIRYTSGNIAIGNLTLAIPRNYKNQDGVYETDFINCVCFKETAERINKYFKKGDFIMVEGRIQTRTYEDKDKVKKYVVEVVIERMEFTGGASKKETPTTEKEETIEELDPYEEMGKQIAEEELPF